MLLNRLPVASGQTRNRSTRSAARPRYTARGAQPQRYTSARTAAQRCASSITCRRLRLVQFHTSSAWPNPAVTPTSVADSDRIAWLRRKYSRDRTCALTYDVNLMLVCSDPSISDQILITLFPFLDATIDADGDTSTR